MDRKNTNKNLREPASDDASKNFLEVNVQYINMDFPSQSESGHKQQHEVDTESIKSGGKPKSVKCTPYSPTTGLLSPRSIGESQPFCFLSPRDRSEENIEVASCSKFSMTSMVNCVDSVGLTKEYPLPSNFRIENRFIQSGSYELSFPEPVGPSSGPRVIRPPIIKKVGAESENELTQIKEKSLEEFGYASNNVGNWDEIIQPPKENLYKLLRHMIDNHIKPNVQVMVGGVIFNCHMMVLQCYSDFFLECNNELIVQLPEDKITPGAFVMVYDWMMADEPLVQREGILELFNAAHFLRMPNLINQCWLCLDDEVRFCEDTAFMLYLEARNYNLQPLEELMLTRICKFFLTLVSSKDFLLLNIREVCTLLTSNTIGVNSETEIFMAAIRWMSYDWDNRECHILDLARCIRYSLLPPWFLISLSRATDSIEVNRLVRHPVVARMISDGISFNTAQLFYGRHRGEYLTFLERYDLMTPVHRQWVYDSNCSYHTKPNPPSMGYVTYQAFLEYLQFIQQSGPDYWRSLEMIKVRDANSFVSKPAGGLSLTSCSPYGATF